MFAMTCRRARRGAVETRQRIPAARCVLGRGARTHLTRSSFRAGQPAAAKREAGQCDDHPDKAGTIRHGTAVTGIAEENSVPEGRAKSAQAPIRRPPSRGGPLHRSASKRFFSSTGRGAFSFWRNQKENGGRIPAGPAPCGSRIPRGRHRGGPSPLPQGNP